MGEDHRQAARPFRRRGKQVLHVIAASAMVLLAGCVGRLRPTPTPMPAAATRDDASPTAPVTATAVALPTTATESAPTATDQPPTLTAAPPTATPTQTPKPPTPTPRPATATPTVPPPTSTPLPPTATPFPEAVIHSFRANVNLANPGDTITLSWQWSGGTGATIYHLLPTGQLSTPYWHVGPTGSLQYTISPQRRNYDSFVLYVHDESGVVAQQTVQVELRCADAWFFSPAPEICPADAPLISSGAEQHFERGTMLWVGAEDRIYALFADGQHPRWSAYTDEWDEGEPTMDPAIEPPPGLQQPIRGFGLVWREEPTVRARLGWAVDQERGYETALQRTSHYRYPVLYIRALAGGVWKLGPNGSQWERISTSP